MNFENCDSGAACLCAAFLCYLTACRHSGGMVSRWQTVTEQSKTDVLAPLVITDLKHRLQTGFEVSVGLPLLSAKSVRLIFQQA